MEKKNELTEALEGLAECGHGLVKMAEALKRYYAVAEPPKKTTVPKKKEPTAEPEPPAPKKEYSKEDIRKLLADAANKGHREKVKGIIQKHGASSLSQIDPSEYEAIAKEAEVLANA